MSEKRESIGDYVGRMVEEHHAGPWKKKCEDLERQRDALIDVCEKACRAFDWIEVYDGVQPIKDVAISCREDIRNAIQAAKGE